jgi:hypothetical protein
MAVVTPLRPSARVADTVRPRSGARLRTAIAIPPPPLSVVERHAREVFPCQATTDACTADADVTVVGLFAGLEVVVLLCRDCAKGLPPNLRPVPIAKESK